MKPSSFSDFRDPLAMSQQERFAEIGALLARGFLRLQPGRLERLRSATGCAEDSADSSSISLDNLGKQSVHASVNQE